MQILIINFKIVLRYLVLFPITSLAQLNMSYLLSGKVNDDKEKPLTGATAILKDSVICTSGIYVKQKRNNCLYNCYAAVYVTVEIVN